MVLEKIRKGLRAEPPVVAALRAHQWSNDTQKRELITKFQGTSGLDFDVTDKHHTVHVKATGIPPQMFREGIGVVVEGTMSRGGFFQSDRLKPRRFSVPPVSSSLKHLDFESVTLGTDNVSLDSLGHLRLMSGLVPGPDGPVVVQAATSLASIDQELAELLTVLLLSGTASFSAEDNRYTLQAGDEIRITVFKEPDMSGQFRVGMNGLISVPGVGEVRSVTCASPAAA